MCLTNATAIYAGPWLQGHREKQLGLLHIGHLALIACAATGYLPEKIGFPSDRLEAEDPGKRGTDTLETDTLKILVREGQRRGAP